MTAAALAPFTLPLRREGDAAIVDKTGKTVLVIDPDRDLDDDAATRIADLVFARLSAAPAPEGGASLLEAADKAHRACMSAWSCGEPYHRVKTMMDAVERLGAVVAQCKDTALATREEAPAGTGVAQRVMNREDLTNATKPGHPDAFLNALLDYTAGFYGEAREAGMPAASVADAMNHVERAARGLHALALRAQPPAREDAQPDAGARLARAMWGVDLIPAAHPAPDALRAAVAAYLTAVDDLETPVMSPSLGLHRKEVARQARGKLREALAALQAEQKGGAA